MGGGSRGRGTIERNISGGGFFQGVIPLRFIVTRRSLEFILLGSFETDRSSFEEKLTISAIPFSTCKWIENFLPFARDITEKNGRLK